MVVQQDYRFQKVFENLIIICEIQMWFLTLQSKEKKHIPITCFKGVTSLHSNYT